MSPKVRISVKNNTSNKIKNLKENSFVSFVMRNRVIAVLLLAALVSCLGVLGNGFKTNASNEPVTKSATKKGVKFDSLNSPLIKAMAQGNNAHSLELSMLPSPFATGTCDASPLGNIEVEGTGGSGTQPTAYATLAAAFTAINTGVHTGTITIDVCGDTTETATATLNASGGSASYTTITMSPAGGAARTISGAVTAGNPMIDLNGADNVIVDGLNTGGNSLTISNTTVSGTSGTSTIRFQTDATNNTVTNTSVLGSATMAAGTNGGNIWFGSAAVTTGNDNNTISNCNIGPAGANLPSKGIYFSGSSNTDPGTANSGIIINNNNIFDYFNAASSSAGIDLNSGSTNLSITNNKFYQTATRTFTAAVTHTGIRISNTSGNNYQVTGNTIGFANAGGTGTYTITGNANLFRGIHLQVGSTTASNIQNNTVAGISQTTTTNGTSTSSACVYILPQTGLITTTGNTVGSLSATGSLTYTSSSASNGEIMGIFNFSSQNSLVSNNNVGGITLNSTAAGNIVFNGIRTDLISTVTATVSGNTVGGTVANSINNTATATGSRVIGINHVTGLISITGNTVRNMTMSAANTGTTSNASVIGISQTAVATGETVSQNTIHSLSNTNATAAVSVIGINHSAATTGTTNVVARNFIHSLSTPSTSATATITGIGVTAGVTTYRNNMIALGNGLTNGIAINGINETGGTDNFYHNSVYIGGTGVVSTANTFAFQSTVTTNTRNYRDNIFFNARSNGVGTGKHYAIRVGGTAANPTGLTSNNNVLFANGTGSFTGLFNAIDRATLADWRTATGQDLNSFSSDPQYLDSTNATTPDLHINPSVSTVVEGNGADVGVTDDFDGQTRASFTPVDIGADAGNFTGIDLAGPNISYTAFANTTSTANRVLSVTITDATGVNLTAGSEPRIYFRKGTSGAYTAAVCTMTGGTAQNGTYDCTIDHTAISAAGGDTVQYYVAAQDTLGNVSTNPSGGSGVTPPGSTPPGSPNSYNIILVVSSYPYSQDFETGAGSYTSAIVGGSVNDWVLGTPAKVQLSAAHSGTNAWVTKTTGTYSSSQNAAVVSPIFNFSALASDPTLSFWQNFDISGDPDFDSMVLEVSTNGGTVWNRVDSNLGTGGTFNTTNSTGWYNLNGTSGPITGPEWTNTSTAYTGHAAGWIKSTTLLVGLAGQADVRFRWRFVSDGSDVDEGFAIDDIQVSADDITPPVITYTTLGNTTDTTSRTLTISVTDQSGVPTSGVGLPRLYYRKGTSDPFATTQCVFVSGSNYDCTFDYSQVTGGSVTAGDTIQYYVAAQDSAATPNVAVNPSAGASGLTANPPAATTPPTTPNSFLISIAFTGEINVGGSETYTSLTRNEAGGIFKALNEGVLTGNVIINITSDLTNEDGAVSLNQLSEQGVGGYTVTFRPGVGGSLLGGGSARLVSGANATALINLTGADRVTFDGLNTSGNSLTIRNTNASGATIRFGSDSSNNTIQNCTVEGANTSTTSGVINISSGTGTTGNDNNLITNNVIRDRSDVAGVPANLIFSAGISATVRNSGNTISNNTLKNFTSTAITTTSLSTENWTITNNTIFQEANRSTSIVGIFFEGDGTNTISQNTIRDLRTSVAAGTLLSTGGIVLLDARNTTVSRNHIYNFPAVTGGTGRLAGIEFDGHSSNPASVTLVNNMVSIVTSVATNQSIMGIFDFGFGGNTFTANHNSVYVGGTAGGTNASWALVRGALAPTAYTARNNIAFNNRTGGGANHFAGGDQSLGTGTFVSNFNFFAGTGTTAANFMDKGSSGSGTAVSFASWQTGAPTRDANSIANTAATYVVSDYFANAANGDLHLKPTATAVLSAGTASAVTTDYDNDTRPASPDIGADELIQTTGGTLAAGTYYNVAVAPDDTLGGNVTITGTITLQGVLNTGANTLTIGCDGTIEGASSTNFVNGTVSKAYCSTGSFTYPVGTTGVTSPTEGSGNEYAPVNVNITALAVNPSNLAVSSTKGTASATPPLDDNITLDRYWTLTETGELTADVTFNYLDGDVDGTETDYNLYKINDMGALQVFPTIKQSPCLAASPCIDTANNIIFVSGLTSFSNWLAGALAPTAALGNLSGYITNSNGQPVSGVLVTMDNVSTGQHKTTITDANGHYLFQGATLSTDYQIVPLLNGYRFSPNTRVITLNETRDDAHFVASESVRNPSSDYDGDGIADLAVWRPSDGNWYIWQSTTNSMKVENWGVSTDRIVPADYDGDGKMDVAVFRPSEGNWYIRESFTGNVRVEHWGLASDKVIPADYDGDGRTDLAVYRPSDNYWYIKRSSDGSAQYETLGQQAARPVIGDFDRDGRADIAAVINNSSDPNGQISFVVRNSGNNTVTTTAWGLGSDVVVSGDYDGDRRADYSVYRASEGVWYVKTAAGDIYRRWGINTDEPLNGDFDGDGMSDFAIYRTENGRGYFYIMGSSGQQKIFQFGVAGDVPIGRDVVR